MDLITGIVFIIEAKENSIILLPSGIVLSKENLQDAENVILKTIRIINNEEILKKYQTPNNFSNMIMSSDGTYLTGLWFEKSKDASKHDMKDALEKSLPIFDETCKWLDIYFTGKNPNFTPKYKIENETPFRKMVTKIMNEIPYGKTISYAEISNQIANIKQIKKMSAQAVGHAVRSNPICIIVPCHRVIGKSGKLVGYGGGLENKIELLKLENSLNKE